MYKISSQWSERTDQISTEADWNHFMSCEQKPNFRTTSQLHDYTTWIELEKNRISDLLTSSSDNEIKTVIEHTQPLIDVICSYDRVAAEIPEKTEIYQHMMNTTNDLIDQATLELLKHSDQYKDDDSQNIQLSETSNYQDIHIWGNLANNPRLKNVEFHTSKGDIEMTMLRNMKAKKLALRVIRKSFGTLADENIVDDDHDVYIQDLTPVDSEVEEGENIQNTDSRKSSKAQLEASSQNDENTIEPPEEKISTVIDYDPVEEFDKDEFPPDYFSLDDYGITGGTWQFDIFEIPSQPKQSGKWIIKRLFDEGEGLVNVTDETVQANSQVSKTDLTETENQETLPKTPDLPKIEIKITMPIDQVILAPPEVAIWDSCHKCWRGDGISNVKFDEKSRNLTFQTSKLGKFTVLQDRKLDLPYQFWELSPTHDGSIEFTLNANYTEMKFNLVDNKINIVEQVHEELSGTSLIVSQTDIDVNEETSRKVDKLKKNDKSYGVVLIN